jgi:hypothetical protein
LMIGFRYVSFRDAPQGAGPESISPPEYVAQWIPRSRFARPGMTAQ